MKAEWQTDYDFHEDKCFKRPCCPECCKEYGDGVPIIKDGDIYRCINCGEEFDLDPDMKEWIDKRSETKTEYADCPKVEFEHDGKKMSFGCGGKSCVEQHYIRNPITLEWRLAGSVCKNCKQRIIV